MADYVHFSAEPVKRLVQREIRWGIEPFGAFWFSDESRYGWRQWCIENEYGLDGRRGQVPCLYYAALGLSPPR